MKFGMFMIGEYVAVTLVSAMLVTLFFGGWLGPWLPGLVWFLIKTGIFISLFVIRVRVIINLFINLVINRAWNCC